MQAEYFDAERPELEVKNFYRSLNEVNRIFAFAQPFQRLLPNLLGEQCRGDLSILDVGAGDGTLGRVLSEWATKRNWNWKVTNLDLSWSALRLNPGRGNVAASALALPFRAGSFDVVIASQMAHHLNDSEVVRLLRETWRVARRAVVLSDLHRNWLLYLTLWLLFKVQIYPKSFCADGLLSVRRAWRAPELKSLARQAELPQAQVSVYYAARVILASVRTPRQPPN